MRSMVGWMRVDKWEYVKDGRLGERAVEVRGNKEQRAYQFNFCVSIAISSSFPSFSIYH